MSSSLPSSGGGSGCCAAFLRLGGCALPRGHNSGQAVTMTEVSTAVAMVVVNSGSKTSQPPALVAVAASVAPAAPVKAGTAAALLSTPPPALRLRGRPRGRGPGTEARGGAAGCEGGGRAERRRPPKAVGGGLASVWLPARGGMAVKSTRCGLLARASRVGRGVWRGEMGVAKGRPAGDVDVSVYGYGVCGFSGPMWAPTGCCAARPGPPWSHHHADKKSDHTGSGVAGSHPSHTQLQTCVGSLC